MIDSDLKLFIEIGGFALTIGGVLVAAMKLSGNVGSAVTKFELIGEQQATEIREIKIAIEKIEGVMSTVAVQKDQIQSIREQITLSTRRTDETFSRVFDQMNQLTKRRDT